MAKLEYFIVCRAVAYDVDTSEVTLSQVIEDVFLEEVGRPYVLPKVMAVSCWNTDAGDEVKDFQTELIITRPGEEKGQTFPMNLARGPRRHRAMQGILQIPLDKPGSLKFEVRLNGDHAATHTVIIHPPGVRSHPDEAERLSE